MPALFSRGAPEVLKKTGRQSEAAATGTPMQRKILLRMWLAIGAFFVGVSALIAVTAPAAQPIRPGEEVFVTRNEIGHYGGRLAIALRAEPKTLNPVTSVDLSS